MFQSPDSDVPTSPVSPVHTPRREKVRILLFGSLSGILNQIKVLHKLNYAEPNDWSEPIPTGRPNEWMVILTKHPLIE